MQLILGPCSAESREQTVGIAEQIHAFYPNALFRAGIWKPRTKPGHFEGIGPKGLPWLQEVRERFGFTPLTEVGLPEHVEHCLKHGIDHLWIGARTTSSPFIVSEIGEALKGVKAKVWVKNPIHHEMPLWMGAIERLKTVGQLEVMAIHRGFQLGLPMEYRNWPNWEVRAQLQEKYPGIPVFCDPSHISGQRRFIEELAIRAQAENFDGLMIEVHDHPEEALSDQLQQVTPAEMKVIMQRLKEHRARMSNAQDGQQALDLLRQHLSIWDVEILRLLKNRKNTVLEIAKVKASLGMPAYQKGRWAEHSEVLIEQGKKLGLSRELVNAIFERIHLDSLQTQMDAAEKG